LDHWIARQVLKMSEETWQTLLEGDVDNPNLLALGRSIVQTREALFPETMLNVDSVQEDYGQDDEQKYAAELQSTTTTPSDEDDDNDSEDKQLEELLNSLGDLAMPEKEKDWSFANNNNNNNDNDDDEIQMPIGGEIALRLVEELELFRKQNVETAYTE
jgi:hypothetical protein